MSTASAGKKKGGGAKAVASAPSNDSAAASKAAAEAKSDDAADEEASEGSAAPGEVSEEQKNDANTGLVAGESKDNVRFGFDILANIKSAQLQNGLRHGDHMRYRQYCSRRLRRLRVGLGFTTTPTAKAPFKERQVSAEEADDVRYLALPLVSAERCWAYAMQLKADMTAETKRKKFHLIKRLTKAASWATKLEALCAVRADTRTQLQAEAYSSWMGGSILLERELHEKALAKFLHAKTVYEKLGSIGGSAMQILCEERVASLDDSIRFCKYQLRNHVGGAADDAEVDALAAGNNELLAAKLEELRKERMVRQAKTLETVEWQGKVVPVSSDKLRLALVEAKTWRESLDKAVATDASKVEQKVDSGAAADGSPESQNLSLIFQKLFGSYDDALRVLRDALLEPKQLDAHKAHLTSLKEYCTAARLEVQLVRNLQFIHTVTTQLRAQEANPPSFRGKRLVKPDEVVLLFEKLAQALQELADIATANKNAADGRVLAARLTGAQACRTFYLAESYRRIKRFIESYMLYARALELMDTFTASAAKLKDAAISAQESSIAALRNEALLLRGTVHAQVLLEDAEKAAKLAAGVSKLSLEESAVKAATKPLAARLDSWDGGDAATQHSLLTFPPSFQPAPTKPILFDLAFNTIEYPDISAKLKAIAAKKTPAAAAAAAPQKVEAKKPAAAAAAAAPVAAKKEAPKPVAAKKPATPEPEEEEESPEAEEEEGEEESEEDEEEEAPKPAAAAAVKKQPQPAPTKKIAPPGEKESVRRERERLAREEEEKKKAAEEAKKAKGGWGFGGLLGKLVGNPAKEGRPKRATVLSLKGEEAKASAAAEAADAVPAPKATAASRKRDAEQSAAALEAESKEEDAAAEAASSSDAVPAAAAAAAAASGLTDDQKASIAAKKEAALSKRAKLENLEGLIPDAWQAGLAAEFKKAYWPAINKFLRAQDAAKVKVFPPREQIFRALDFVAPDQVRVVILGQDPYHDDGQAEGLCFSVPPSVKRIPPSLNNIYKELETDIKGFKKPSHGNLVKWAEQGVLLLNTGLTVKAHEAASHKDVGWGQFTDAVISLVNKQSKGVVFILWGGHARTKAKLVDKKRNHLLETAHPSPLSCKGFFGCKHFSKTNELLIQAGHKPIVWQV